MWSVSQSLVGLNSQILDDLRSREPFARLKKRLGALENGAGIKENIEEDLHENSVTGPVLLNK